MALKNISFSISEDFHALAREQGKRNNLNLKSYIIMLIRNDIDGQNVPPTLTTEVTELKKVIDRQRKLLKSIAFQIENFSEGD